MLVAVDGDDRVHRRIEDAAQACFAPLEERLGADALGDVAQDDREEPALAVAVLRDRRFDWKFLAVRT